MTTLTDALARLGGIASRQQLAEQLGISQASFSRLFQASRDAVVAIGRGRAVRYALRGRLPRVATPLPVWRVDADGRACAFGELQALSGGRFLFRDAVYDSLPWLFWDMRPQGFIGRGLARRAAALALPNHLNAWTDEDILVALTQCGGDNPGDLLLGHAALDSYLHASLTPATLTCSDYPGLIATAMQGGQPGSSAGGEQPKFAVTLADGGSVIVKFSPPTEDSPAARRWADALVCEHLALEVLRGHGQAAAASRLLEDGGRVMLETRRFDRTAAGRKALLSGLALGMQFAGVADGWTRLRGHPAQNLLRRWPRPVG